MPLKILDIFMINYPSIHSFFRNSPCSGALSLVRRQWTLSTCFYASLVEYTLGVADFIIYVGHLLWHAKHWGSWGIERSHGKTSLQLRLSFLRVDCCHDLFMFTLRQYVTVTVLMPKKLRPAVDLMAFKYRTIKVNRISKFYSALWCSLGRACQVGTCTL
jgi:hypothetical protein